MKGGRGGFVRVERGCRGGGGGSSSSTVAAAAADCRSVALADKSQHLSVVENMKTNPQHPKPKNQTAKPPPLHLLVVLPQRRAVADGDKG